MGRLTRDPELRRTPSGTPVTSFSLAVDRDFKSQSGEKETDFIFTTVGEEWGFIGSVVVLALLCALILRLMKMGERQQEPFSRIYCYCVASVLLFHVMVNVGMNVGLMPVMGIPLPFLSYGGSSLVAFTILVFIAIRLDASPTKGLSALN